VPIPNVNGPVTARMPPAVVAAAACAPASPAPTSAPVLLNPGSFNISLTLIV